MGIPCVKVFILVLAEGGVCVRALYLKNTLLISAGALEGP